ncbi:DUF5343 domain-containing protein [Candidatus Nitrotoga sp. AM1P]|uniref:DUF5343 domain-containing protein n=1 Tax=Candidatus Nitrotoga sp. AM1P TaxID=2559597 RepID=UPI001566F708|nr:DUF5343 domain-containing protein [Candidatus Nitrotoga sp. AM1P]
MADFNYTTVPGKIKPFLEKIRQIGVPPKATVQWLKTIGFKSSNDTTLLGVLKSVGLVDASGVPTGVWSNYRGAHHKTVLGDAIRTGYAELFAVYPDAWQQDIKDLEYVFSTSSSAGKQVISKTVATFKSLCECAEFGEPNNQPSPVLHTGPMHAAIARPSAQPVNSDARNSHNPSVHIDIQIHISPEASTDQIDQIFKSMAKHLYGAKENE